MELHVTEVSSYYTGKENEPPSPSPLPPPPPTVMSPPQTYPTSLTRRSRSSLVRSMGNARGGRTVRKKCIICKRRFQDGQELRFHLRDHIGERPFGCTICGKGYLTKPALRLHLGNKHGMTLEEMPVPPPWAPAPPIHHEDEDEEYYPPPRSFAPVQNEEDIRWTINPPDDSIKPIGIWYRCKICQKCIQEEAKFIDHINAHTDEEIEQSQGIPTIDLDSSDESSVAGGSIRGGSRSSRSEENRGRNERVESNAEQGNIDRVRKLSVASDSVESNVDFHGPPPEKIPPTTRFFCEICPKHYNYKGNLLFHQAVHHYAKKSSKGVKMYKCRFEDCSKKFMNRDLLMGHFWNHTAESRFKCPDCGQGFPKKSNYISHSKDKHPRDQ